MSDGPPRDNSRDEELLPPAKVLRAVKRVPKYVPPGQDYPTSEAFIPSDPEKDDARREGLPVRVSVWDEGRTTPAQVVEFRRQGAPARAGQPQIEFTVYSLATQAVHDVRAELTEPRLRVVRDVRAYNVGSGADGHCGIEGLDATIGVANAGPHARAVREALARRCSKVTT